MEERGRAKRTGAGWSGRWPNKADHGIKKPAEATGSGVFSAMMWNRPQAAGLVL